MPKPRPNSKREQIIALFESGERDYAKIATLTGAARTTVEVYACHFGYTNSKIRQKKLLKAWDEGTHDLAKLSDLFGYRNLRSVKRLIRENRGPRVSTIINAGFHREARRRNMAPEELAARLLIKIDEDSLYGAVLDEGDLK